MRYLIQISPSRYIGGIQGTTSNPEKARSFATEAAAIVAVDTIYGRGYRNRLAVVSVGEISPSEKAVAEFVAGMKTAFGQPEFS